MVAEPEMSGTPTDFDAMIDRMDLTDAQLVELADQVFGSELYDAVLRARMKVD